MRALHGGAISMIFQNPRAALNPIRTVGRQIADVLAAMAVIAAGRGTRPGPASFCAMSSIREPREASTSAYPHELSGGMCQRVVIAAGDCLPCPHC